MTQNTAAAPWVAPKPRPYEHHDAWLARVVESLGDHAKRDASGAYRAGINAAAVELRRQAREMRQAVASDPTHACGSPLDRTLAVLSRAAALEIAADSLAELPGGYEPSGLEYRGG